MNVKYANLISARELIEHLGDDDLVVADCRFDLDRPEAGQRDYVRGHIPGAVYAHLERNLSSAPVTDAGRHPLPSPEAMRRTFEHLGIGDTSQVVVYDDSQGMYACRLWWMLNYMGHDAVAVLDGGLTEYLRKAGPLLEGIDHNPEARFTGKPRRELLVVKSEVGEAERLVDARDADRYRGEVENRDPRAGHIPGALNYPWRENIAADGRFRPPETIRTHITEALRGAPTEGTVFYCGSGVSACVDVLATSLAGFGFPKVYVGSWSEWSRDETLPVATGGG
jgi:thiosulfate/3-mercaptopyruvate sulfurtransferase